jgi:pilus assembly protein Flp/PilA
MLPYTSPFLSVFFKERRYLSLKTRAERGQGLVEYALILVLVAIVVIAILLILGPMIGEVFSTIQQSLCGPMC